MSGEGAGVQADSLAERLGRVRSALFLPASNPRAIAKARTLGADLVILDLEDAVREGDKDAARAAAVAALGEPFGDALVAIRANASRSRHHAADVAAIALSAADLAVLPKADRSDMTRRFAEGTGLPILAMIETPAAVLDAREVAGTPGVVGLIAGTNDLSEELGIAPQAGRAGLVTSLQLILLAARTAGILAIDGVFNALDDAEGFLEEARAGRAFGFDAKALIHPDQVEPASRAFAPTRSEIEEARALVAAATGGAERHAGRMIEDMHVAAARRTIARGGGRPPLA